MNKPEGRITEEEARAAALAIARALAGDPSLSDEALKAIATKAINDHRVAGVPR